MTSCPQVIGHIGYGAMGLVKQSQVVVVAAAGPEPPLQTTPPVPEAARKSVAEVATTGLKGFAPSRRKSVAGGNMWHLSVKDKLLLHQQKFLESRVHWKVRFE